MLGLLISHRHQTSPQHRRYERRHRHRARRLRRLRGLLPVRGLALRGHDRAADPHRGRRSSHVHIALADRQHLPDASRRPQHHLDDLLQLTIRRRTRQTRLPPPTAHCSPDRLHLLQRQRHRLRRRLAQPSRVSHRVLPQCVITHRQPERETQHRPRLLRRAVALRRRQRLQELIHLAHTDLTQREVLERRHHQLPHVPLIQRPRALSDLVLQIEVSKPHVDESIERTVTSQLSGAGAGIRPLSQSLLEPMLGELASAGSRFHPAELPVEIAEPHAGADTRPDLRELNVTERTDWSARSSHDSSPARRAVVVLPLVVEPPENIGFGELQMTTDLEGCRAVPGASPVVNRLDGNAEVVGQLVDGEKPIQAIQGRW